MHPKYPHVFDPITLGPITVPNRFYFSPHGVYLTIGSRPSTDYVHYQAARAKGGCGLIVCSLTMTERGRSAQPSPHPRENVLSFRALADAVHDAGSKIFGQIWYHWLTPGHWQLWSPAAPALSASTAQLGYGDRTVSTHEMGHDEIRAMTQACRQATAHLREAGFDGVVLHASHGGIIEQFVSPYFNRREDEYGGSVSNRMRFLTEALQAAHDGAAGELAVGIRLNCDELLPGGYDTDGARTILKTLADTHLIDFVDLDIAVEPNQLHLGMPPVFVEPHVYRPYVEAVRGAAGRIPVLSVLGRLTSMADAERVIASGTCDMVGAARQLIAEPEFVNNVRDGHEQRNRTCIACNWCLAAAYEGAQGCTINPASYRERNWGIDSIKRAKHASKVVIIGAGPGGLEAARVSALRGHEVTVFEARGELGGALELWARLPGREVFRESIRWWERELVRLGVDIRLGIEAGASAVLAQRPDAVIVATGARYSEGGRSALLDQDIAGHQQSFVHRPEDILLRNVRLSRRVVLVDAEGLHTSVGIAEILGKGGAEVEYITPCFSPVSARLVGNQDVKFIMKRLGAANVKLSPSTFIRRIGDHEVTVYDVHTEREHIIADVAAVVLCTSRVPVNGIAKQLEGKVAQLFTIGDALAARLFATASYEGQKFARYVGEPDAPRTFAEAFFQGNPPEYTPAPAEVLSHAAN